MKKFITISLLLLVTLLTTSCKSSQKITEKSLPFDYGKVENNIYSNSFFGFSMEIPETWHVQDEEINQQQMELSKKLLSGDDEEMENLLDASEVNVAILVNVFKYEVGSPVDFNPSISITAENIKGSPGVQSGADYLFHAKKILEQADVEYSNLDADPIKEDLNGKEFYYIEVGLNFPYLGRDITQRYYSAIANNFSLIIAVTYTDEEQKNELEEILKTLKFN